MSMCVSMCRRGIPVYLIGPYMQIISTCTAVDGIQSLTREVAMLGDNNEHLLLVNTLSHALT